MRLLLHNSPPPITSWRTVVTRPDLFDKDGNTYWNDGVSQGVLCGPVSDPIPASPTKRKQESGTDHLR